MKAKTRSINNIITEHNGKLNSQAMNQSCEYFYPLGRIHKHVQKGHDYMCLNMLGTATMSTLPKVPSLPGVCSYLKNPVVK